MLSVDDCHCIVPVFPDKVNTVAFVPEQIVVAPAIVPATEIGFIVIAPETFEVTVPHVPETTT